MMKRCRAVIIEAKVENEEMHGISWPAETKIELVRHALSSVPSVTPPLLKPILTSQALPSKIAVCLLFLPHPTVGLRQV